MTLEQRVGRTEQRQDTMEELIRLVVQDIEENRRRTERNEAILEEMRRENRQTRRIWIAIARKQELFDDEEFDDVFGDQ
jgi:hypothetical protein